MQFVTTSSVSSTMSIFIKINFKIIFNATDQFDVENRLAPADKDFRAALYKLSFYMSGLFSLR